MLRHARENEPGICQRVSGAGGGALSRHLHFRRPPRHAGGAGRGPSGFPQVTKPTSSISSATSSISGGAARPALAAEPQRRAAEAPAQGAQGHADRLHSRQPRRGLRDYCGTSFGGIEIHRDNIHIAATGRRYVVMHGDEFDVVVRYARWLAFLGDRSYELALWSNDPLNWVRRHSASATGRCPHTSRRGSRRAVRLHRRVRGGPGRRGPASQRRRRHLRPHPPCRRPPHRRHPLPQCGDWVESCTAIAETRAGEFAVLRWLDEITRTRDRRGRPIVGIVGWRPERRRGIRQQAPDRTISAGAAGPARADLLQLIDAPSTATRR